ncbi:hypothetical protein H310_03211 [Aphanomyces invadans]|uniref:Uncharacterized protein n=1 Tax=Aphanomyces invadans TaxID=157072 RepID=A0A024UGC7_9STRA|nr:hypothetical protein H310_03211 [Aphanomyces invadans]ETW05446.1 hypothetical protein H310_03211 [Aphanomyces invadans]|eukprot:XP_008865223.1 hypothetical protein H310_03211 [Aphanomyces invadans]
MEYLLPEHVLMRKSFQKVVVTCGNRLKDHPSLSTDTRVKDKATFNAFACTSAKCPCRSLFYIVAEGAWVLRCRCKHKHIDHDATASFDPGDVFKQVVDWLPGRFLGIQAEPLD